MVEKVFDIKVLNTFNRIINKLKTHFSFEIIHK